MMRPPQHLPPQPHRDLAHGRSAVVQSAPVRTAFWPLFFISLTLITVLGWELAMAGQARRTAQQLRTQQNSVVEQSQQVQLALEKLARDLVELGKTDPAAQALVTKYNISVTGVPSSPGHGALRDPSVAAV